MNSLKISQIKNLPVVVSPIYLIIYFVINFLDIEKLKEDLDAETKRENNKIDQ